MESATIFGFVGFKAIQAYKKKPRLLQLKNNHVVLKDSNLFMDNNDFESQNYGVCFVVQGFC
jgi:hypothetical protein